MKTCIKVSGLWRTCQSKQNENLSVKNTLKSNILYSRYTLPGSQGCPLFLPFCLPAVWQVVSWMLSQPGIPDETEEQRPLQTTLTWISGGRRSLLKIVLVLRGVTMSLYLLLIDIRKWDSKHSLRLSLPLSYRGSHLSKIIFVTRLEITSISAKLNR